MTTDEELEQLRHENSALRDQVAMLSEVESLHVERRQVIDLPPKRVLVIEHQAQQKCCPRCQQISLAAFPDDVRAPVQYGAAIGAVGVYLVQQQLLPYERACEVVEERLGPSMSVGTLQGLIERCAQQLEPVEQQIKAALSRAEVLHQDETGLYVAGHRHWMHESRDGALDALCRPCQAWQRGLRRHRHPGRLSGSEYA